MERLGDRRPSGMNTNSLRTWGMLFAVAGIVGRCVLQKQLLRVGTLSGTQLLEVMQVPGAMAIAAASLLLQAIETCAVPVFAFLLVEGFQHTGDWKQYLFRVAGTAVISEIPYDLAMGQKWLDLSVQNPMFALVLGLILLWMYQNFALKKSLCVVATLAAIAWAVMLRIEHGVPMLILVSTLWIFRKKPMLRGFMGSAVAVLCTLGSLFYLAAPMGFLATHFYNGEKGESNRLINYLFYPVALLVIGLVAMFLI